MIWRLCRSVPARFLALLVALGPAGCAPGSRPESVPLAPAETFDWRGLSLSFSPPPDAWRREGTNQGGWKGVQFVLTGSVGERIIVADHYVIADRDRRRALEALLENFDRLESRELRRELSRAHWRTDDPLNDLEVDVARRGNEALDRATVAMVGEDRWAARREIGAALREARRMQVTLDDVVDRVRFRPERHSEPERWTVLAEQRIEVAGVPALAVDYAWRSPEGRRFRGRELYFVHERHLFTASFHGLEKNLSLFERILATIGFPPLEEAGLAEGA